MSDLPLPIERVIGALSKLPSIGRKTAQRLTFHLLNRPADEARQLAEVLSELHEKIGFCTTCHNLSEEETCLICLDTRRDPSRICVVEEPLNVLGVERTAVFRGLYHVLGGALSPLKNKGPDDLNMDSLLTRLEKQPIEELILATSPTVEGEATAVYLARLVQPLEIRISRLAQGLPAGADLEFTDPLTLQRAFEGRRDF